MRFEPDSPVSELMRKVPHISFKVNDLYYELSRADFKILSLTASPGEGTRAAMIVHNGATVELIEFTKNKTGL